MRIPFELGIAVRYLRARRRESFISLNTWLSAGGVVLGVTALITVLSVMTGFEESLREKILGVNAHVTVYPLGGDLGDHESVAKSIEEVAGVVGATPFAMSQVMLMAGGNVQSAVFRGVDLESAGRVIDIERFVLDGQLGDLRSAAPSIVVGREVARALGLAVGDAVEVVSTVGKPPPLRLVPRMRAFRVAGIFASGMHDFDNGLVFVSLGAAQSFLQLGRGVTGIEVRVADIFAARGLARAIEQRLGPGYWARDWMEMNRILFRALRLQKFVMALILALIVLVAAFNIASSLIMVVLEKTREIGILKSMGANNRSIRRIFVAEGLVIGGLGTSIGLLGGWILCLALKRYQFIDLPGDVYYLDTLPVVMKFEVFGLIAVCSVALCYLAALYPSWQAARLDPVEIIRYE